MTFEQKVGVLILKLEEASQRAITVEKAHAILASGIEPIRLVDLIPNLIGDIDVIGALIQGLIDSGDMRALYMAFTTWRNPLIKAFLNSRWHVYDHLDEIAQALPPYSSYRTLNLIYTTFYGKDNRLIDSEQEVIAVIIPKLIKALRDTPEAFGIDLDNIRHWPSQYKIRFTRYVLAYEGESVLPLIQKINRIWGNRFTSDSDASDFKLIIGSISDKFMQTKNIDGVYLLLSEIKGGLITTYSLRPLQQKLIKFFVREGSEEQIQKLRKVFKTFPDKEKLIWLEAEL